jgi:hypothetical protein
VTDRLEWEFFRLTEAAADAARRAEIAEARWGEDLTDIERAELVETRRDAEQLKSAADAHGSFDHAAIVAGAAAEKRAKVRLTRERQARADEAWEARTAVLVQLRCRHCARRRQLDEARPLADVYTTPLGLLFVTENGWRPSDLAQPPNWLIDERVCAWPPEVLELDDIGFLEHYLAVSTPGAVPGSGPVVMRDLVDLGPRESQPDLWVRCEHHAQPALPSEFPVVRQPAEHGGFGTRVDRARVIGLAAQARRDGRIRDLRV